MEFTCCTRSDISSNVLPLAASTPAVFDESVSIAETEYVINWHQNDAMELELFFDVTNKLFNISY